jgi:NAD(P)-dependent dehydrogenase (short-subunit alcohol dehydrogenase family)
MEREETLIAERENVRDQFVGRVAVVTGGTQGLGEATARLFAERGAAGLVICGRSQDRGQSLAEELTATGCSTSFVQADLERVEDCFRVVDAAERAFDRLDTLVNCAACTERGTVDDTDPGLWDRMFAINVRAPFFLLQRSVALMRRRNIEGTIVNVISVSSHGGAPYLVPYAASKGALATLTRNTANALLADRIRVNGLNIGWMNTPGEHTTQKRFHDAPDDWLDLAAKRQPFGRLLGPDEVARAIAFLASEESGMMTGSVIDFDQVVVGTVPDEQRF